MLFRMPNKDEVLKFQPEHSPTGPRNQDGKVFRKGLRNLRADREPRGRNVDRAKPKRGAKEVRGKVGELNFMSGSQQ